MANLDWQQLVSRKCESYRLWRDPKYKWEEAIFAIVLPIKSTTTIDIPAPAMNVLEDIRSLLTTKIEDINQDIELSKNTRFVLFDKKSITAEYDSQQSKMNFAKWLNSFAPLPEETNAAIICDNLLQWNYILSDLVPDDKMDLKLQLQLEIRPIVDKTLVFLAKWLERAQVVHLYEIIDAFETYLMSINLPSIFSLYEAEELVKNNLARNKIEQKLKKSAHFFESHGILFTISEFYWKITPIKPSNQYQEGMTEKIEKNRKLAFDEKEIVNSVEKTDFSPSSKLESVTTRLERKEQNIKKLLVEAAKETSHSFDDEPKMLHKRHDLPSNKEILDEPTHNSTSKTKEPKISQKRPTLDVNTIDNSISPKNVHSPAILEQPLRNKSKPE